MEKSMRSVMTHQFSQVPRADIPRSSFDRSHGYKTTFDSGLLVPIFVDEALPGDTFNLSMTAFGRLATPLHPFMDNMFLDVFFFACPIRLVWDNFPKFFGEQANPGDSTSYLVPTITSPSGNGYEPDVNGTGKLADYFGIPTKVPGLVHSALWHRAHNLIYNEWFRDQNLLPSLTVPKGDGPDDPALYGIQRRTKRHDYFTSALPWPQKGPTVNLPLGSSAPVVPDIPLVAPTVKTANDAGPRTIIYGTGTGGNLQTANAGANSGMLWITTGLHADLTNATAATINQLRQAFQIQRIYERDARGGTRYTEIIQSHFGVVSPDARLNRPEYLGGGTVPLNVNPIAQTSAATAQPTPQGNLAAMGTTHMDRVGFTKSFTEHTLLLGFICARADLNYQQGLNRMWSRSTRFDFYWPALAHIGEQTILNKELYAVGSANPTQDNAAFGYQERFAEYRYKPSVVTGRFRSNAAVPLDTWHLAQTFASLPVLGPTFIAEFPPVARVIAVPSEPHFLLDCFFRLKCARPMPLYGVPGLIDHF